jgi:hypothetical protein
MQGSVLLTHGGCIMHISKLQLIGMIAVGALLGSVMGTVGLSFADNLTSTSNMLGEGVVIPYDGYLMLDSSPMNTAGQTFKFALFESPSGGTPQWVEEHVVNVHNGRFSVSLGQGTKLSSSPANATFSQVILDAEKLYISVSIIDAQGTITDLAGRQAIEAAPFAAWAATSSDFEVSGALRPQGGIIMRPDTSISGVDQIVGFDDLRLSGSAASGPNNLYINNQGDVTVGKKLKVTGDADLLGTLDVTGSSSLSDTTIQGTLDVTGSSTLNGTTVQGQLSPDYISMPYNSWSPAKGGSGGAAIINDNGSLEALSIFGNRSAGGNRKVKLYDDVQVSGDLTVNGALKSFPEGSYCILRSGGSCPTGFQTGRVVTYGARLVEGINTGDAQTGSDAGGDYVQLNLCCK